MPSTPVCCLRAFFLSPILVAVLCVCIDARLALAANAVVVATYEGVINPVAAEYFHDALTFAETIRAQAIVLRLEHPGGLDTSMRLMIKDITRPPFPWSSMSSPSSGRAASAGVFITMAAHVAAMAPGTNIGAAHPVAMGGAKWTRR